MSKAQAQARIEVKQFRLVVLFAVTAAVALVTKIVIVLAVSTWFYAAPIFIACVGAAAGRMIRRPLSGAVFFSTMFFLYVLTIPLADALATGRVWPFVSYQRFEWYSLPFYRWAETVDWIWPSYYIWATFCEMVPAYAIVVLAMTSSAAALLSLRMEHIARSRLPDDSDRTSDLAV